LNKTDHPWLASPRPEFFDVKERFVNDEVSDSVVAPSSWARRAPSHL